MNSLLATPATPTDTLYLIVLCTVFMLALIAQAVREWSETSTPPVTKIKSPTFFDLDNVIVTEWSSSDVEMTWETATATAAALWDLGNVSSVAVVPAGKEGCYTVKFIQKQPFTA